MIHLYGISNCNTVKKARTWFTEHHIDTEFHDFKKQPPTEENIRFWLTQIPKEILINRKGTTWRKLDAQQQQNILASNDYVITMMLQQPSIIKRPVVIFDQKVIAGFDENNYQTLFSCYSK